MQPHLLTNFLNCDDDLPLTTRRKGVLAGVRDDLSGQERQRRAGIQIKVNGGAFDTTDYTIFDAERDNHRIDKLVQVSGEIDGLHVQAAIELLMKEPHRLNAMHTFFEMRSKFDRHGSGLNGQQTGYDLEVVLNAVMDLLEKRFLLLDLAFSGEAQCP